MWHKMWACRSPPPAKPPFKGRTVLVDFGESHSSEDLHHFVARITLEITIVHVYPKKKKLILERATER